MQEALEVVESLDGLYVSEELAAYGVGISGYRGLKVWEASVELAEQCYRLTAKFPGTEQYGLVTQIRRAAVSVSLNVAEGWGRGSQLDLARFCDIARGSATECDAAVELAKRLGLISTEEADQVAANLDSICRMLRSLALQARKRSGKQATNTPF